MNSEDKNAPASYGSEYISVLKDSLGHPHFFHQYSVNVMNCGEKKGFYQIKLRVSRTGYATNWRGKMQKMEEKTNTKPCLKGCAKSSLIFQHQLWGWLTFASTVCLSAFAGGSPSAGVYLGPNHTHYLLLHFRFLGVNVGISYLAVFISEIWITCKNLSWKSLALSWLFFNT